MCTQQAQQSMFSYDVPVVCHMGADHHVTHVWIKFEKYGKFPVERGLIALKSDVPGALCLNLKFEKRFEKNRKLSYRAPGMSDFNAMGLIRQEIVHNFRILIKHGSHYDLHPCGTQQAHHRKKSIVVPVVCTSSCICVWWVHILGGGATLKFGIRRFQRCVPIWNPT